MRSYYVALPNILYTRITFSHSPCFILTKRDAFAECEFIKMNTVTLLPVKQWVYTLFTDFGLDPFKNASVFQELQYTGSILVFQFRYPESLVTIRAFAGALEQSEDGGPYKVSFFHSCYQL